MYKQFSLGEIVTWLANSKTYKVVQISKDYYLISEYDTSIQKTDTKQKSIDISIAATLVPDELASKSGIHVSHLLGTKVKGSPYFADIEFTVISSYLRSDLYTRSDIVCYDLRVNEGTGRLCGVGHDETVFISYSTPKD